jgi:hypothetical protein
MESVIEEEASLLPKLILDKQDDFDAILIYIDKEIKFYDHKQ